jgi:hypothetical protein
MELRNGGMGFDKIAHTLNAERVPTKRSGTRWHGFHDQQNGVHFPAVTTMNLEREIAAEHVQLNQLHPKAKAEDSLGQDAAGRCSAIFSPFFAP